MGTDSVNLMRMIVFTLRLKHSWIRKSLISKREIRNMLRWGS